MSAELPVDILFRRVVERGLCARCGTCVGVCPTGNIVIEDFRGECIPSRGDNCISCGLCLGGCPGERVDFIPLEREIFGEANSHPRLGAVRKAYLSYATEKQIRERGASGGIATAIQLFLLRSGKISGSVLYSQQDLRVWKGKGVIAEDEKEIIKAAQSRYQLSPMNTVLGELSDREGSYAFVGLPCQVHGVRKALRAGWKIKAEIKPVIGIYCGNNLFFEATRVMLKKLGIERLEDLESLSYREGGWPGNFSATLRSGEVLRIPKLDFNQAIPFYVNHRCLTCIDLTNELTDISIGDGWAMEEESDQGWSIVLARTGDGERILRDALSGGAIHLEEISLEEAEKMHSHGFDLKKRGAFIRLKLWKGWGKNVPSYDRENPEIGPARKIIEFFVSIQFIICSSRFGRMIFRILPVKKAGLLFRALRKVWMKGSKK